ncbi:hypothetical protein ACEK07_04880 [Alcanivoracaceae bacterium MT1]
MAKNLKAAEPATIKTSPKQTAKPTGKAEQPVPLHLTPDYAYELLNLVADDEVPHGVQLGLIESRRA